MQSDMVRDFLHRVNAVCRVTVRHDDSAAVEDFHMAFSQQVADRLPNALLTLFDLDGWGARPSFTLPGTDTASPDG